MAPFLTRYSRVGMAARMRVSSVISRSALRGTLRSQRTNTTLPLRSASVRSPTDFLAASTLKAARGALAEARALVTFLPKKERAESTGAAAVKAAILSRKCGRVAEGAVLRKSEAELTIAEA